MKGVAVILHRVGSWRRTREMSLPDILQHIRPKTQAIESALDLPIIELSEFHQIGYPSVLRVLPGSASCSGEHCAGDAGRLSAWRDAGEAAPPEPISTTVIPGSSLQLWEVAWPSLFAAPVSSVCARDRRT